MQFKIHLCIRVFGFLIFIILTDNFSKLNAQNFEWAKSIPGNYWSAANYVTTDDSAYIYITGRFEGTVDFDPGPGTLNLTANGYWDAYLVKMDSLGNLVWADQFASNAPNGESEGFSIALDNQGTIYLSGKFDDTTDFDPGPGVFNLFSINTVGFVAEYAPNGNFISAIAVPAFNCSSIAVDNNKNIYVAGYFYYTADFDIGPGVYNLTSLGPITPDVFVCKYDSLYDFIWAKQEGGKGEDRITGMALDASGNVYVNGTFQDTADFDLGPGISNLIADSTDIFTLKLDSAGNFLWAKKIGGVLNDYSNGVATGQNGDTYVTANFSGTVDFNPSGGSAIYTAAGPNDISITKYGSAGNYLWTKIIGSALWKYSCAITTDIYDNIYLVGKFGDTLDFDPGLGIANLSSLYGSMFNLKLDKDGNFIWAVQMPGYGGNPYPFTIHVNLRGEIFSAGYFDGTVDFNPGPNIYYMTAAASALDAAALAFCI
jgi:hypothetical protein